MRHWLILGMLAAAMACSSDSDPGDQNGDSDGDGDAASGDRDLSSLDCQDLNEYVDGCYSNAGCPGAFGNLEEQCEDVGLTSSDIGERVGEGCEQSIRFFCNLAVVQENTALFSLSCCQEAYACPDDLVCEPDPDFNNEVGYCITASSSFPAGARTCSGVNGCDLGFRCVTGESSSKCVQICVPD